MATIFRAPLIFKQPPRALPAGVSSQPLGVNLGLLIGIPNYGLEDWSNPVLRRGLAIGVTSQNVGTRREILVGQDIITGARGQVPDYDWPNPTLRRMTPTGVLSQPLGSSRQLLLTGADKLPFRQMDWPVHRPRNYTVAITAQEPGSIDTPGYLAPPFVPITWSNPTLRLSHMQALLAQQQGSARNVNLLVGQDTFFGAPGQVQNYNWPAPIGPPGRIPLFAQPQGTPFALTAATPASPFIPLDWPNPIRETGLHPSQPQGTPQLLTLLPGQDQLPDRQSEWPVPPGPISRVAAIAAQPAGTPLVLTTLAGADQLPENQTDWPNPTRARDPWAANRAQPNGSPLNLTTLVGQDLLPFNQDAWPNPRGPVHLLPQSPLGSPDNLTLLPGQDALPFRQSEWPVVRGKVPGIQTQPLGIPLPFLAASLPQAPFSQDDWPVPKGPQPRTQTQPLGTSSLLTLLPGKDQLPVRQQDWANPGLIYRFQLSQPLGGVVSAPAVPFQPVIWENPARKPWRLDSQPLGRLLDPQAPFTTLAWPNPTGPAVWRVAVTGTSLGGVVVPLPNPPADIALPVRAIVSRVALASQPLGTGALLVLYPGTDFLPFAQFSWPNPRGPEPRTQTQPLGVTLQVRRPAAPGIIAKPCNSGSMVTPNLGASKIPVNLDGEKSSPDLSGEVKNDGC